jgi:hypothetical protein
MYYLPQPPFLVILIGFFIFLTCGSAFQNLMEQKLRTWAKNPEEANSYRLETSGLAATYWGICLGIWVFLAGGFLILGFGIIPSYGVALPLTLFTGSLIWVQLSDVFLQLKEGGSKALDLDDFI